MVSAKIAILVLVGLLPSLMASEANAQVRCPPGQAYCAPGGWGPGGCYNRMGQATCQNGQICSGGLRHCGPGPLGPGGCYNTALRYCDRGAIKQFGTQR